MKTLGLIGGMSWESTSVYYKYINSLVNEHLGGLNNAKLLLDNINFSEIAELQHSGDWLATAEILIHSAQRLEKAGAECMIICTNTMHCVADQIKQKIQIPILHIADATAEEILTQNLTKVGLLGTGFTMQQDFFKSRLKQKYKIDVIVPNTEQQELVHNVIYNELCKGEFKDNSKIKFLETIQQLKQQGAQGVILGCTEIPLLVSQTDTNIPLFDTTFLHSKYAVNWALS